MTDSRYYAQLSPKDFDSFDCVKLAPGIYLILLFVLRAYIIWLLSVTNMRDHVATIQWLYPERALFYLNLVSGAIALFIVLVLSLRRPDAKPWVRNCWQQCKILLIVALAFDLLVATLGYFIWHLQSITWLFGHGVIVLLAVSYILRSKRFTINIAEFPATIPEK
ncbi:Protein of unknown function [Colwellia chukchiensis]|uniref:DUF2919 family protein n=1 Tax=Colwellia chukchiensis TaxID=641665 RepID=A0A1H7LWZ4_9GAMM|nr:DUF2919 family protein [Colwellia chukchiensis]SEL03493.1 Protein of unknown function [Colwellia chukchiensis]